MRKFFACVILWLLMAAPAWATVQDVNIVSQTPPPAPGAPASVSVSGITDTTATVSWPAVDTATQYAVFVNGQQYTGSSSPGVTLTGLTPHINYTVYVVASNAGGDSTPSSSASFTTLPPVPTAPGAPTVDQVTANSATITWQPLPAGQYIKVYRIYVDGQAVSDVSPQTGMQSANLTKLPAGAHSVAVAGANDNQEGPQSPAVTFNCTTLAAPAGLEQINHSPDTVWLQWEAVPGASYNIYQGNNLAGQTDQASYTLSGLQAATEYQVSVVAMMPDGNQSLPARLQVQTLPAPEPLTVAGLEQKIFFYVGDVQPEIIVLFVVVAAFALARTAKVPFTSAWRWRP